MKKVILVTGASSGIGKITAIKLAKEGHIVYGTSRDKKRIKNLENYNIIPLTLDVTKDSSIKNAVSKIIKEQNKIDVLVNNAGYGSYGAVEEVPINEGRQQFEVNLFGLARLTQIVIPYMRKRRSGQIINISSVGGKVYTPFGAWYHATKFAVEGFSDALRLELKPFGIKVTIIEPGAIKTNWDNIALEKLNKVSGKGPYKKLVKITTKFFKDSYKKGRGAKPDVVAFSISKAIKSKKPKFRYATPWDAKIFIAFRWLLNDKAFDKLVRTLMKWPKKP